MLKIKIFKFLGIQPTLIFLPRKLSNKAFENNFHMDDLVNLGYEPTISRMECSSKCPWYKNRLQNIFALTGVDVTNSLFLYDFDSLFEKLPYLKYVRHDMWWLHRCYWRFEWYGGDEICRWQFKCAGEAFGHFCHQNPKNSVCDTEKLSPTSTYHLLVSKSIGTSLWLPTVLVNEIL